MPRYWLRVCFKPTAAYSAADTLIWSCGSPLRSIQLLRAVMETLIVVGVIVVLVAIIGIYLWSTYNGLVRLNVRVDEAWSDITVQLKRRADLLPNLIETVKGYAAHESGVFEAVTKARAESIGASTPADAAVAENHVQRRRPIRSSRPVRITCSCRANSLTPKTRSRRRAAFTTVAFVSSTPTSRPSRTRSSFAASDSPSGTSSRSPTLPQSPSRPASSSN
jgi:hypothetical protein